MGPLNPWLLASVAAVGVGTVLLIVSVATPAWSVLDVAGNKSEIGPFKRCESKKGFEECSSMGSEDDSVNAVKAMTIIGLLGAFAALAELVYGIVVPLSQQEEKSDPYASEFGFAVVTLLFTIIGDIVWGAKVHGDWDSQQPYELGYSFALSIVGAIIVTIGGGLSVLAGRKTEQATENE